MIFGFRSTYAITLVTTLMKSVTIATKVVSSIPTLYYSLCHVFYVLMNDRHNINVILLKVALNNINLTRSCKIILIKKKITNLYLHEWFQFLKQRL
jgi:hypothetical protein